jgi:hypothetical protein
MNTGAARNDCATVEYTPLPTRRANKFMLASKSEAGDGLTAADTVAEMLATVEGEGCRVGDGCRDGFTEAENGAWATPARYWPA